MIVTLLTDFGWSGPYVAAVKGVLLSINPNLHIVDISHTISPQNTDEAAFVLAQTYPYFPSGTIHVVVVDPGVGSDRTILAVKTSKGIFLAPDNGVLKYVFKNERDREVFLVTESDYFRSAVSHTFHGRDVFAPVAAHLSLGVTADQLGPKTMDYQIGQIPEPAVRQHKIIGQILYFDSFGNAITNIAANMIKQTIEEIKIGAIVLGGIKQTYCDATTGETLALIGSHNHLEIAINQGNIQKALGLAIGDPVTLNFCTK